MFGIVISSRAFAKERSLRIMTGVIKRYKAAREKVSACDQQARVRFLAKSPVQVD